MTKATELSKNQSPGTTEAVGTPEAVGATGAQGAAVVAPTGARPAIGDFSSPADFLKAMLVYRKQVDASFSVVEATRGLRKLSSSLVSLAISGKRKITLDRADEFAKLMQLNAKERAYFRAWIARTDGQGGRASLAGELNKRRKEVGTHLLSDWINVYVKDCFQLPAVQKNPTLVHQYLASHAEPQRIQKSIEFLLREGYLRRTLGGETVVETNLAVATTEVPSKKIRQFHKGALGVAKASMDLFPPDERLANTLIIPLNKKSYAELNELIQDFAEKLQEFAANNQEPGERLYQLILNLSPTGGKVE
jgi:uncharacterized protein (TIGR02147 family)